MLGAEEKLPFLQFTPHTGIGVITEAYLREHNLYTHHPRIVLNSVEAIMQCVIQGIGFTLLPEPDVRHYSTDNQVERIQPEVELNRRLALVTQPASPIGRKLDKFVELFL